MKLLEIKVTEARQPEFNYTEKRHAKTKKLEKVFLELEGVNSAAATRLAKRYERLDRTAKMVAEKRNELNAHVKELGDALFDAEDALATRIINTVSFTMMLTAGQKAEQKEKKYSTDYEAAYKALATLVPELEEKAKEILNAYTVEVQQKDTPVSLKVGARVKEGFGDTVKNLYSKTIATFKKLAKDIQSWGKGYDRRLESIQAQFSV